MKKTVIILLLLAVFMPLSAFSHKVRFSMSGAYSPVNGLSGGSTFSWSPKISISYPVSPKNHIINTEISILTLYESHLAGLYFNSVAFGFGIRVFFNDLRVIRPYFNHEVLSRVIFAEGRSNAAKTYSILLGLGIDIPLQQSDDEVSSIFIDGSYVFYDTGYFDTAGEEVKTIMLTLGYSLAF